LTRSMGKNHRVKRRAFFEPGSKGKVNVNCNDSDKSVHESWFALLAQTVGFILFFIAIGAILCGLLFVTGNTDFRTRTGVQFESDQPNFRGLSEIPTQLQR
jgi:hypothetical protein